MACSLVFVKMEREMRVWVAHFEERNFTLLDEQGDVLEKGKKKLI